MLGASRTGEAGRSRMALTTPSRLTRKKKQQAIPEPPPVSEEEKENGDMLGSGSGAVCSFTYFILLFRT